MVTPTSMVFAPVTLPRSQATRLESMMQQQVQDAVLAHTAQRMKHDKLDSDWRFVCSLGQLKTFKTRGTDSFTSTSSWTTTIERTCNVNDRISTGAHTWTMRSRSSGRSRTGRLSFSRRTVGATVGRRDPLDPRPPIQSHRTFGRVQGNYRDIVDAHYAATSADFVQQQKLLSPVVTDGAVLHTIRATKDSYLGIKWLAENSFAGKHDSCFVEMVGYTINTSGQEIGFVAVASVDIPECPDFTESMKLTRVRMKRTTLIIPAVDTPKATSEIFVMGASEANVSSIIMHAQYRLNMAVLNDISLVIDSQNIANQTLAPQKNWVPDASRPSCSICNRKFHFMYRRRHHCRLCGDIVCKTCYVTRAVPGADIENGSCRKPDAAVISQTKFCVRCVMGLRSIDKRLDKFSQQISKMLSLNVDKLNASTTVVAQPPSESNQRDLVVSSSNESSVLDMDDVYHIPGAKYLGPTEVDIDDDDTDNTSVRSTDAESTVPYEASECKYLQPSLSVHSQSHHKLPGLSQLNRHSSAVSLGSEPDIFEEKVILNMDKLSRIVAI
ncbi:1-phosphatidylinositol 3-phosphate 5-kinase fab1 [Phytophthora cinnamomi]|uniref:1-phosphatidylinositol 3-phosphate 5-kinase fab1 n=1 Tax=Phytophthora cinnamomi TaxID=4785 RepID=UPI003559976E|nr:1-phosphatidylinositol 3-phosphate 5-kinase fab1 [Phytophthora cinnamomi]